MSNTPTSLSVLSEYDALCMASQSRVSEVRARIRQAGSALVAFSGGVDSAFLLKLTAEELGASAIALTAISPSVPEAEVREAQAFAQGLQVRHVIVKSDEIANPNYAANPTNRCYFCKTELYTLAEQQRQKLGLQVVFDGFNADDKKDHRPGHQAATENRVQSPLSVLTKVEIRAWSKRLGLSTWDKPQMPCLASRIPYGTQVTVQRLKAIEVAEAGLKALGLRVFRVRYQDDVARLEVSADEFTKFADAAFREAALDNVKKAGFRLVVLDLEPFRSGRLNDGIARIAVASVS